VTINTQVCFIGLPCSHMDFPETMIHCDSVEDLPETPVGGVIINQTALLQDDILMQLHAVGRFWGWRIYVVSSSEYSSVLSDGLYEPTSIQEALDDHHYRYELINIKNDVDPVVGWLGLDKSRRLLPYKDVNQSSIYSYPLISAIYPDLNSTDRYLMARVKEDILTQGSLLDRIRICGSCAGGHLNYVEICPSCQSIDLTEQQSLHCFTCGHVAEQNKFKRKSKLECSNCLTQLRHIGVDYDRPLESLSCNSCAHQFVESDTLTVCFSCGNKAGASDLPVRQLFEFKLGFHGEYILRNGKQIPPPELRLQGKVSNTYFVNIVDWLNRLAIRHKEQHLLLGLYLPNLTEFANRHGEAKMYNLVNQITDRLNGLFRDSDICCLYRNDVLLVLLPKTNLDHMHIVKEKIGSLSESIQDEDFALSVFAWNLPDAEINDNAEAWFENKLSVIYAID
jgi:GGDEF domain-containing protein